MAVLSITSDDFLTGESTSDLASNRGFSPSSYALNLIKNRGLLAFNESPTDASSSVVVGNPIAWAYDANFNGNDAYILDASGNFYTTNNTTTVLRQSTGIGGFALGTSDILQFKLVTYATSDTRVVALTGSNLATIDSAWWTGLSPSYRHPLERVEDTMYIGDFNVIHTYDGTTSVAAAITLPTEVNITSLRKHPDGRQLIAFCGVTANYSHTRPGGGKIYLIDTVTKRWTREIESEAQVEGSRNVGGVIYVTYGDRIGYFNGSGITFLKKMNTSTVVYSSGITNIEDILCVTDGTEVLAFGDLGKGNIWWSLIRIAGSSNNINMICYEGSNKLLMGYNTNTLVQSNFANSGNNGQFYTNRYYFPGRIKVRKVLIVHAALVTSAQNDIYYLDYVDETSTANNFWTVDATKAGATTTRADLDVTTQMFQLRLRPNSGDNTYFSIHIFYDFVEQ